jgi:hypothetical protein
MNEIQKQVHNIQQSAQTDPRFKQHDEVTVTPEAKEFTNRVFRSLLPHFPAWRQSCPEPEDLGRMKNAWTKAIMRHEIKTATSLNIKAGLLACEQSTSDWLPSVGKFIELCVAGDNFVDPEEIKEFAQRALVLFNANESQIDNVGLIVSEKAEFRLKTKGSPDSNTRFIELYCKIALDKTVKLLPSNLLTQTVQLSPEQEKDKQKRAEVGRNEFMSSMCKQLGKHKPKQVVVDTFNPLKGISKGSTGRKAKTPKQLDDERARQLDMIKGML